MKFYATLGAVLLPFITSTANGIELDPENEASIKAAARTYAYGLMDLYQGNATGTAVENIGIWPQPHYWWEGGEISRYVYMRENVYWKAEDSFLWTSAKNCPNVIQAPRGEV